MIERTEILELWGRPRRAHRPARLLKVMGAVAALVAMIALATAALASHGDPYIDLASSPGLTVPHNGAVYAQGGVGAGTGNFDPFTTANAGGSTPVEAAINVCDDPGCPSPQFDTFTGGGRTHEILLSAIPELSFDGSDGFPAGTYREFTLDANDQGSDDYMSIDDIQILLDQQVDLTGFDPSAGTFTNDSGDIASLVYDLDVPVLMRSQTFTPGSGVSDITLLVPTEDFVTSEDCSYGSSDCEHYVYFYFKAGAYDGSAGVPSGLESVDWDVTSGFEEWRTRLVPVVDVSKTAVTSFDRAYDWTVEKSVDPERLDLFDGDSETVDWTVTWTKSAPIDSNIQVSGTITILNPTGDESFPIHDPITARINGVGDVIDLGAGGPLYPTVECGVSFPYDLGAGDTLECTYSQAVTSTENDGTNTATVNIDVLEGTHDYEASAEVDFATATINVTDNSASLSDLRAGSTVPSSATASGSTSWSETFACDSDEGQHTNTVTLTEDDSSTQHQDSASVQVNCYTPAISKTATGEYRELHEWEVDKSVDPFSLTGFIGGQAGSAEWTVTVTETVTLDNYLVEGTVTISNPHPSESMSITLSDNLIGDSTAVTFADDACDGTDANPNDGLDVAAGTTVHCEYSASPPDDTATGNHAEFTLFDIKYQDDANFTWEADVDGPTTVDLFDTLGQLQEEVTSGGGEAGSYQSEYSYTDDYVCSSDKADYGADGHDNVHWVNVAVIKDEGEQLDTGMASLDVDCYAPLISKTAAGSYDEEHDWKVSKSVDPGSLSGFIGGGAGDADWLVTVTETVTWSGFEVSGTVTIQNPHPSATMSLASLSDALDDATPGVFAVDACTGSDPNPNDGLDISAGGSVDCDYTASPSDKAATENTATATLNSIDFTASDPVEWTANVTGPTSVSLTDDEKPLDETVTSAGGAVGSTDTPFPYTNSYVCSSDKADYAGDGHHAQDVDNTAVIKDGETELDSDSAHLDIDCYAPLVSKDAQASFDRTYTWDIDKTASKTDLLLMPGQVYTGVEYTVTVDVTSVVDDNFAVEGEVSITNPHPDESMPVTLSDVLDDTTTATFTSTACDGSDANPNDGLQVPADTTVHCAYTAAPTDKSSTQNKATVTLNSIDFNATASVDWSDTGADVNEIDDCVDVEDTEEGFLGTVCADEAPHQFKYTRDFGPFGVEQCGELDFPNTASFETNDTAATGSDNHNVHVTIPCPTGCTLTLGYWKTHNDSFPGGAPTDDTWDEILPDGEETVFFLSGQTWFEVFWTAPKGNVYYNLAHQYMAAVLNRLNGASDPGGIDDAISDAEALFNTYTPDQVDAWKGKQGERKLFIELAGILGDYNEGLAGVPHCDEDGFTPPF
jgi:hypothetical protein